MLAQKALNRFCSNAPLNPNGFLGAVLRAPKPCKFGFVVTNPNPYGMRFLYLKTSQRLGISGLLLLLSEK
jgi:hypothetical protein